MTKSLLKIDKSDVVRSASITINMRKSEQVPELGII